MPFNETQEGKTYYCTHLENGICNACLGNKSKVLIKEDTLPEYNHSQLYILINALENLMIPANEMEYEFIRNNLLERFRKAQKEL